jgi:hypothetical protein
MYKYTFLNYLIYNESEFNFSYDNNLSPEFLNLENKKRLKLDVVVLYSIFEEFEFITTHLKVPEIYRNQHAIDVAIYHTHVSKCLKPSIISNHIVIFNIYDSGIIINPYGIPFLNTALLLTSGGFITLSHKFLKKSNYFVSFIFLILTIVLSFIFMFCQFYEYKHAAVSMNDGAYGSIMFLATGFHGLHVIIGTVMLVVCLFKMYNYHFTPHNHIFFKCSI